MEELMRNAILRIRVHEKKTFYEASHQAAEEYSRIVTLIRATKKEATFKAVISKREYKIVNNLD